MNYEGSVDGVNWVALPPNFEVHVYRQIRRISDPIIPPPPKREPVVANLIVQPWDGDKESLIDSLVSDVATGIRVLRSRDGSWLTEDQIMDRARNIVAGLIGNYNITKRRP